MRPLFSFLVCLFMLHWGLAQTATGGFQLGVGADGLVSRTASNQSPASGGGGPIGGGQHFYLWSAYGGSQGHGLRLQVGYRVLGDYQVRSIRAQEVFTPTQVQEYLYVQELQALHFLDADLSWQLNWQQQPRWQLQLGGRVAYLLRAQGRDRANLLVNGLNINNTETVTTISDRSVAESIYDRPLDQAAYAKLDWGATLSIAYELTSGLSLRTGVYQGFNRVLGATNGHRVRSWQIGVQARLF